MSFVRSMFDLVDDNDAVIDSCEKQAILDVAKFQIEMVVNEYDFCTYEGSSVALACVLNAIESVTDDGMLCANFEATVRKSLSIDDNVLRDLRVAVYELMNDSSGDSSSSNTGAVSTNKTGATKTGSPSSSFNGSVATECKNSIHTSPRTVATSVSSR